MTTPLLTARPKKQAAQLSALVIALSPLRSTLPFAEISVNARPVQGLMVPLEDRMLTPAVMPILQSLLVMFPLPSESTRPPMVAQSLSGELKESESGPA